MGDQVDQLRGQVESLRLALRESMRETERCKQAHGGMHGLMTRAFELRQETANCLEYLVEACSMSVPMDNYHPDVLVFNEDPTRLLREALVLAVNNLEGAGEDEAEDIFARLAEHGVIDVTDPAVSPEQEQQP